MEGETAKSKGSGSEKLSPRRRASEKLSPRRRASSHPIG
jgi:hypothetical protein